MKYLKGGLITMVVIGALPLVAIGFIARFARDSVRTGMELCDEAMDWLDSK